MELFAKIADKKPLTFCAKISTRDVWQGPTQPAIRYSKLTIEALVRCEIYSKFTTKKPEQRLWDALFPMFLSETSEAELMFNDALTCRQHKIWAVQKLDQFNWPSDLPANTYLFKSQQQKH